MKADIDTEFRNGEYFEKLGGEEQLHRIRSEQSALKASKYYDPVFDMEKVMP